MHTLSCIVRLQINITRSVWGCVCVCVHRVGGRGAAAPPIQKVGGGGKTRFCPPQKAPPPQKKKKKKKEKRGKEKNTIHKLNLLILTLKKQICASIFRFRRALRARTDYLSCMSPTSVARGARGELPQQICYLPTNLRREKAKIFGSLRSLAII